MSHVILITSPKQDEIKNMFENLFIVDNVTKNIIREIGRECLNKHVHVSENLITYLVKLLALNPNWGISGPETCRDGVANLVAEGVQRLSAIRSPSMIALKMQLYFNTTYASRTELIEARRTAYQKKISEIEAEIILASPQLPDECAYLYKKIVVYITLNSGLGNPLLVPVQKEVYCALHSIFPLAELENFTDMYQLECKKLQLGELTHLIAGLRIFNKDLGRGGEGIEDLPQIILKLIQSTYSTFNSDLNQILSNVNLLTTAIDNSYVTLDDEYFRPGVDETTIFEGKKIQLPPGIEYNYFIHVKALLVVARQHEFYLRKLLCELKNIEVNAKSCVQLLNFLLVKLRNVVKVRQAIPTAQVFPLFMEISEVWRRLQDEAIMLSVITAISYELQTFTSAMPFDDPNIVRMTRSMEVLTDARRLEQTAGLSIPKYNNKCSVMEPNYIRKLGDIDIEFAGFCPYSLVEQHGSLIVGNPNMGISRWKGRNYIFSSVKAAADFGKDPDRFINGVLQYGRRRPELIFCLGLYNQLLEVKSVLVLVPQPPPFVKKHNARIQTEVHVRKRNINKTYKWNVWDLKRNAIQLYNITNSRTHSMQTIKSHFRAGMAIQMYLPKDVEVQTMDDDYCNVPTLSNFIFGLRGRKDDDQHIVELTRPVHE